MNYLTFIVLVLAAGVLCVQAQKPSCGQPSVVTDKTSHGANMLVELTDVFKVREITGKVTDAAGVSIPFAVIDVFAVPGFKKNGAPRHLIDGKSPTVSYETNSEGEFCLSSLRDGKYVLQAGAAGGGLNQTLIKVHKKKGNSRNQLLIELSPGI